MDALLHLLDDTLTSTSTVNLVALTTLGWAVVGGLAYEAIRDMRLPFGWRIYCVVVSGPATWVLSAYRGLSRLRSHILSRYGIGGYSCCGGHGHRHHSADQCGHHNHPAPSQ